MSKRMTMLLTWLVLSTWSGLAQAQWADLSGQFIFGGDAPAAEKIVADKDAEFCSKHDLKVEKLKVNGETKGIADILVYVYPARGKTLKIHPDYEKDAAKEVGFDNLGCRYEPHVVLARVGQTLVIGNKDPIGHNTNILFGKNRPFNSIIPSNGQVKIKIEAEERRPCKAACNIHPWMNAWLLIQDHPYMAKTDENGKFVIKNLPVGELAIQFRHPDAGYITQITRAGKAEKWSKGRPDIKITAGGTDLGTMTVPAEIFKGI